MNIYVGNLSDDVTEDDLRESFSAFGQIRTINIVKDKVSGVSRGFGFVTMPVTNEAQKAIQEMNGKDLKGQPVKVEEGRTKTNLLGGQKRRSGPRNVRSGGNRRGGFGSRGRRGGPKRGGKRYY